MKKILGLLAIGISTLGYGNGTPTIIGTKSITENGTYMIDYKNIGQGTAWGDSSIPVQYTRWTFDTIGPGMGGTVRFRVQVK